MTNVGDVNWGTALGTAQHKVENVWSVEIKLHVMEDGNDLMKFKFNVCSFYMGLIDLSNSDNTDA